MSQHHPSGSRLAVAAYDVLVTGQLVGTDRPACMNSSGRDANLGAHTELPTVGELGRGVVQHNSAVDVAQESLRCAIVISNDALSVPVSVCRNMLDCGVEPVNNMDGYDRIEVFGRPVLFAGGDSTIDDLTDLFITADLTSGLAQCASDYGQQAPRGGAIDEQRFCCATDARAPHFCVKHDIARHLWIRCFVQVHVTDSLEVSYHGHTGFILHAFYQALATTRDDNIQPFAHRRQQVTDGLAVGRRHHLHGVCINVSGHQPFPQRLVYRLAGMEALRAAAEYCRVPRLQT
jgi:hypothetical protein